MELPYWHSYKKYIILIVMITFGIILYFRNPEDTIWFPKCMFYTITGYQCPSCGIQRAAHQLLHLNFKKAFLYNPFLVISVPYGLLLVLVTWVVPQDKLIRLRKSCNHHITVNIYLILMIIWWIIRNILQI